MASSNHKIVSVYFGLQLKGLEMIENINFTISLCSVLKTLEYELSSAFMKYIYLR